MKKLSDMDIINRTAARYLDGYDKDMNKEPQPSEPSIEFGKMDWDPVLTELKIGPTND